MMANLSVHHWARSALLRNHEAEKPRRVRVLDPQDHGQDHRNPDGNLIGEKHKHRWSDAHRDKQAYVPPDITAPPSDPVLVWSQFCLECRIEHEGTLAPPPPYQSDLIL